MSNTPYNENIDPMTGLYSRHYAMKVLEDMNNETGKGDNGNHWGVILANIFQLKQPHNRYGHPPIDDVINEVGRVLQLHTRPREAACRYGGSDFLLIVPQTNFQKIRERAEQIRQDANKIHVYVGGQPREKIRLSVGVALWPPEKGLTPPPDALWGVEVLDLAEQDLQRCRSLYLQEDQS